MVSETRRGKLALWGWLTYDFANSAFATTILAVIFNRYYAEVVAGGKEGVVFNWGGGEIWLPGATVWSYLISFSTALIALFLPFLGSLADRSGWHKRFFTSFCLIGVISTVLMTTVDKGEVFWGGLIFTFAFIGFGGGNVFYNAFLLDVARPEQYGRISGYAWGLGYLGGGLCLALNLIMLEKPQWLGFPSGALGPQETFLVAGLWWGLFSIPALLFLKGRPRSFSVSGTHQAQVGFNSHISHSWGLFRQSWQQVWQTLRDIRRYPELFKFLLAYLFFNDGIETIIVMASIYGSEVVGMGEGEVVIFFLFIQVTAMVGSFGIGYLADRWGHKATLLLTLGVWLIVVLWAYQLGCVWDVKKDFYGMGFLGGLVMGGSQSVARSLQALLTPPHYAGEFFGFYALSGKASSLMGPFVYGSAVALMGGVKPAIITLGFFFLIGGLILSLVKEPSAKKTG